MKKNISNQLIFETVKKTIRDFLNEAFGIDDYDSLESNDNEWQHQDDEFDVPSDDELDTADELGEVGLDFSGIEDDESEAVRNFERSQFGGNDDDINDLDEHPDEWPDSGY